VSNAKLKKLDEEMKNQNAELEDHKLDAEMSRRKILKLKREYEMLNFCFTGANILFKEI
jgi:hypothetical protein